METYSACYSASPRAGDSNLPVLSDGVAQEGQGTPTPRPSWAFSAVKRNMN